MAHHVPLLGRRQAGRLAAIAALAVLAFVLLETGSGAPAADTLLQPSSEGTKVFVPAVVCDSCHGPPADTTYYDCSPNPNGLQALIDGLPRGSTLAIKGTCVGSFTVTRDLTLLGLPSATLDAQGAGRVLEVTSAKLSLVNIIVTGGLTDIGAGIYNDRGAVTLNAGTAVSHNTASFRAGGIYNDGGAVVLNDDATVGENEASNAAGGIYNEEGTLTLNGSSSVRDNRCAASAGGGGGGIVNSLGTVVLNQRSVVAGNTSRLFAGGIGNSGILVLNDDASVRANTAEHGGGVHNSPTVNSQGTYLPASTTLNDNSTVSENVATDGGGIYNSGFYYEESLVTVATSARITGNVATRHAGGVFNLGGTLVGVALGVNVYGNTPEDVLSLPV